jgi:hypothetical protein
MEPQRKQWQIKREERTASYDGLMKLNNWLRKRRHICLMPLYLKWLNSKKDERNYIRKKNEVKKIVNAEKDMK